MSEIVATSGARSGPVQLSWRESLAVLLQVAGPLAAKGVIIRRPLVVGALAATGGEERSVRLLQRLRRRHGTGPLLMRLGGRKQLILVSPDHLRHVLSATPEPFQSDSSEKHSALAHFQPRGSLISRGQERALRREVSTTALAAACPVHPLAATFRRIVAEECTPLLAGRDLPWSRYRDAWFRIVRRCLFGDHARDDHAITADLNALRGRANWAFVAPRRRALRARFQSRVAAYLHHPPEESLAALAKHAGKAAGSAPEDQIGQWLFAFDAAAIATFRALAVVSSHDQLIKRARADSAPDQPFLRAAILESVRLWPTTPAILRQTDRETRWGDTVLPAGTGVLIHVPFFHRDDERLPFAHRFSPERWLDGDAAEWPLVPFSAGTAQCPAKNLVLLLGSEVLSALTADPFRLPSHARFPLDAVPPTFDQFHQTLRRDGEGAGT